MRHYAIVTAAYWGFTLTDGALRMLVLLHFFRLGFSPFTLAFLFVLYEAAGIAANLIGGWLAVRFGIARMLSLGLGLQITAFLFLAALDPGWGLALSVTWAVAGQGLAGVAKDLTKTASKSAIKLTAGAAGGSVLFRWVAWFTGSKNAMKGIGFFLGGALLEGLGFRVALLAMAGGLAVVLAGVALSLPPLFGRAKPSRTMRELFAKTRGVNLLAAARIALFGARDVWFVVGLPVFLYGAGWSFSGVGLFLALWTIGYGAAQAAAPWVVTRSADGLSREVPAARAWAMALAVIPALLAASLGLRLPVPADIVVAAGLALFGLAFAVNASLHSYLILAYAGSEKAAEDVGFYYAANAAGRLAGTLASGALFGLGGLSACLVASAAMLAAAAVITFALPRATAGTPAAA
jgi:predicted MFS family arabinose efflux permease